MFKFSTFIKLHKKNILINGNKYFSMSCNEKILLGKTKLIIFDTTLRDGEQSAGVAFSVKNKLEIAKKLSILGVDVCEAGFPNSSKVEYESVSVISKEVGELLINRNKPMIICGFGRAIETDILQSFKAIKYAPKYRIHMFLATSDIHLKYKLKITHDECIKTAINAVQYAKSLISKNGEIQFSFEDATRSDKKFLLNIIYEVIKSGATIINIADTCGYSTPNNYENLLKYLIKNSSFQEPITFSTHCHNDLGLATANSISGVIGGAKQVECTINGIGERAGNAALEEIVMILKTHENDFSIFTDIDTTKIMLCSKIVSKHSRMLVQPHKSIVGSNAFRHESGIHQDGILKNPLTYQFMTPQSIGLHSNILHFGKHSGKQGFKYFLKKMRIENLSNDIINFLFQKVKNLYSEKKFVSELEVKQFVLKFLEEINKTDEI